MKTHIAYDYPLRSDFLAQIVLPTDLTYEEARRLGAFLLTLAMDTPATEVERLLRTQARSVDAPPAEE